MGKWLHLAEADTELLLEEVGGLVNKVGLEVQLGGLERVTTRIRKV